MPNLDKKYKKKLAAPPLWGIQHQIDRGYLLHDNLIAQLGKTPSRSMCEYTRIVIYNVHTLLFT